MLDGLCWISIQMFNILRLRALVSTKTAAYSQTAGFTLGFITVNTTFLQVENSRTFPLKSPINPHEFQA